MECVLCNDCVEACNKDPSAVIVDGDESSFLFYVESLGSLPIEGLIKKALNIYDDKCSNFMKNLEAAENGYQQKE